MKKMVFLLTLLVCFSAQGQLTVESPDFVKGLVEKSFPELADKKIDSLMCTIETVALKKEVISVCSATSEDKKFEAKNANELVLGLLANGLKFQNQADGTKDLILYSLSCYEGDSGLHCLYEQCDYNQVDPLTNEALFYKDPASGLCIDNLTHQYVL